VWTDGLTYRLDEGK